MRGLHEPPCTGFKNIQMQTHMRQLIQSLKRVICGKANGTMTL